MVGVVLELRVVVGHGGHYKSHLLGVEVFHVTLVKLSRWVGTDHLLEFRRDAFQPVGDVFVSVFLVNLIIALEGIEVSTLKQVNYERLKMEIVQERCE